MKKTPLLENEYWYGGCVTEGVRQPYGPDSCVTVDLTVNMTPNQAMPLFLSNRGRYLWRDTGYAVSFRDGEILIPDDVSLNETGGTLQSAYLEAMRAHFPFWGKSVNPPDELFLHPIYNTWIELTFDQNQKDVLAYGEAVRANGLSGNVLMIDDGWSDYYGKWSFNAKKFPDPAAMLEKLHRLQFKVMVWICPFITADTLEYRDAAARGILLKRKNGAPAIIEWWNGYSACLDFSNPEAGRWLDNQLQALLDMGVDGFKFDAGDSYHYTGDVVAREGCDPNELSRLWAEFGAKYAYNEYRAAFRAGGMPLMQRLCDKHPVWGESGLGGLIPGSIIQSLTGHPYCCPDMIGGGEYQTFLETMRTHFDEEFYCRYCEAACLMPAMQFSAAPWRILSESAFSNVKASVSLREQYREELKKALEQARREGLPILRSMEFVFPRQGMEKVMDQFMLGESLLVAPVLEKGADGRFVSVPSGLWKCRSREEPVASKGESLFFKPLKGEPVVLELLKK